MSNVKKRTSKSGNILQLLNLDYDTKDKLSIIKEEMYFDTYADLIKTIIESHIKDDYENVERVIKKYLDERFIKLINLRTDLELEGGKLDQRLERIIKQVEHINEPEKKTYDYQELISQVTPTGTGSWTYQALNDDEVAFIKSHPNYAEDIKQYLERNPF